MADEFLAFVGDAPLVAHNADFDIAFLTSMPRNKASIGLVTQQGLAKQRRYQIIKKQQKLRAEACPTAALSI